jgi:hypothetical protein
MLMPDMLVDFATSNKLLSFIDSHLRHAQIFIIKEDFSSCCEKKKSWIQIAYKVIVFLSFFKSNSQEGMKIQDINHSCRQIDGLV